MRVWIALPLVLVLAGCDEIAKQTNPPQKTENPTPAAPAVNPELLAQAKAIDLAKNAKTLGKVIRSVGTIGRTNDLNIRDMVSDLKGELNIIGWQARRVDDDVYVVVYSVLQNGQSRGWPFEVSLRAEVVRYVIGDHALEEKYGWGQK